MKKEVYVWGSLLLLSVLGGLLYYNTVLVDTQAYVLSVYYLEGNSLGQDDIVRVIASYAFKRPVEILVAAMLEPLVGVRQAYSLINMLLYIATTFLFYVYLKRFFRKEEEQKQNQQEKERAEQLAYLGAVLYAVSLPLILYATRVLVDVVGYLTILLGLLLIEYVKEKKWQWHLLLGIVLGFFLLVRDPVVILFPYYFFVLMKQKGKNVIEKTGRFLSVAAVALLPEIIFTKLAGVGTVLSGKAAAITAGKYSLMGWFKFTIVHLAAFHVAYLFAMFGWKKETENEKEHRTENNKQRLFFYKAYGISAVLYLVGIQLVALTSPRFTMVLFPVILPLAAIGILSLAEKMQDKIAGHKTILCCILLYAAISFIGAWLYPSRTLILEDAGGNAVIQAVIEGVKIKLAVFVS
ncbi:glycosyltransferase family 39 protein [Candidatus Woesearchaeota archaeon]|nr:glycosyltransferase family 39 protein [Candidatus Woesearchaeota archaeon]